MFQPVPANVSFPKLEEEILRFWKERGIYEKSLANRQGAPPFVFFEGPPTANGKPHPGHCLTRAIKDLFPRYKTMRGYLCERKAGWDTHGLPVEVEVSKELGIHAKEEIEAYGMEPFIIKCQESVWRYMQEWERLTERLGFWIKLDEAYVTYHQSYIESVWWSLKNLFDRGLLYQGHKIVWWWAQGGTALSSGEVGQGYREVADPSVYVKFPIVLDEQAKALNFDEKTSLVVWTTTPWTLPSNQFVAVGRHIWYDLVEDEKGDRLVVASDVVSRLEEKTKQTLKAVKRSIQGHNLLGLRYRPPFDYFYRSLGLTTAPLYLPQEGEAWANYPHLYANNVLNLQDRPINAEQRQRFFNTPRPTGWHVIPADFVTTETGTGLVHIAPAFGVDDYELLRREQQLFGPPENVPPLLCPVGPDGKFSNEVPDYAGRWVKECDKDIQRDLKARGLLYHQEQYVHDYPFCWRAEDDPLISFPRKSWFIKTSSYKNLMLANNSRISWLPEHIRDGRFGNFLESNVDWALSRERFWGTPLPIWVCDKTGTMEAIGSYDELLAKDGVQGIEVWEDAKRKRPDLVDDLKIHKPYIDAITYDSPHANGGRMRRVSEVIDCWYDSGSMPFAQWGYRGEDGPPEATKKFHEQFPADFISEAIDQTRGWFYSQLAISTLLFGREPITDAEIIEKGGLETFAKKTVQSVLNPELAPAIAMEFSQPQKEGFWKEFPHPFRNCIVLGLMLGEDGQKMSKSKRNYREPAEIFDKYGADALRWFFFAVQPPWTTIRYREQAIKDSIPEFLLRLWNCYGFFVIYANIDGFDPAASKHRPAKQRGELDRWVLSELNRTVAAVVERMDQYDNFEACKRINEFVDGLSNWYVRRSRDRFWASEKASPEKLDAYWTLYECLTTSAKMIAPFVPFLAETLWQNLAQCGPHAPREESESENDANSGAAIVSRSETATAESVHLCDYPTGDASVVDEPLSQRMRTLREIASLGRAARMDNKLKVRQPLASVHVILSDATHQAWLEEHEALLKDELNVKQIDYIREAEKYITYQIQPNFKRLGPRVGKLLPGLKAALAQADGGQLLGELSTAGKVTLNISGEDVVLDSEDIQVRLQAKPGWAAAQGAGVVVVLNTELTPELIAEGNAKDVVRLVQDRRKAMNLDYTDRIEIGIVTDSAEIKAAIQANLDYILGETLADSLVFESLARVDGQAAGISDFQATLYVRRMD